MIPYTISLSSNPSSTNIVLNTIQLSDITSLTLSLSNIDRSRIPVSLRLRWGDNSEDEFYNNNFFIDYSKQSILDQVRYGVNYTLLREYNHVFYPSDTSLSRNLSCQVKLTYQDSTSCRFVIPITIYSPSFYSKVGDLKLQASNFVSSDKSMLFTFSTNTNNITELLFNYENAITN